jgi:hypothetical protein
LPGGVTDRGPGQCADRPEDDRPGSSPDRGITGPFLRSGMHWNHGDSDNKDRFGELHCVPLRPFSIAEQCGDLMVVLNSAAYV